MEHQTNFQSIYSDTDDSDEEGSVQMMALKISSSSGHKANKDKPKLPKTMSIPFKQQQQAKEKGQKQALGLMFGRPTPSPSPAMSVNGHHQHQRHTHFPHSLKGPQQPSLWPQDYPNVQNNSSSGGRRPPPSLSLNGEHNFYLNSNPRQNSPPPRQLPLPQIIPSYFGVGASPISYNIYNQQQNGYKSSTVGSVFGGNGNGMNKPLISPPRLNLYNPLYNQYQYFQSSSSYGHSSHQYHQNPGFGYGYGMFYGISSSGAPEHFGNGNNVFGKNFLSRSSSQSSSGFVSQGGGGSGGGMSTPTRSGSAFDSAEIETETLDPMSHWGSTVEALSDAAAGEDAGELKLFNLPNERQRLRKGGPSSSQSSRISRRTTSSKSDIFYSDDEENEKNSILISKVSKVSSGGTVGNGVGSSCVNLIKRRKHFAAHEEPDEFYLKRKEKTEKERRRSSWRNYIFQLCLRLFIFLNVLSIFCLFFVGEWPPPLNYYLDTLHKGVYYKAWDVIASFVPTVSYLFEFGDEESGAGDLELELEQANLDLLF